MCSMCSTFSEFILALVLNTVLFSKKNFNLKTPATHATHCGTTINPHFSCGTSATHGATQVLQTPSYLLHTKNIELNVNRKSRISGTMSTNMEIDQRYTSLRVLAPPKWLKKALNIIFKPTYASLTETDPRGESPLFLKPIDRSLRKTRNHLYFT